MKFRSADDLNIPLSEKPGGRGLIGVMADSHGRPDSIRSGIAFLKDLGCETIYHLGDIGDSAIPEQTDECVRLLIDQGILAIKGNNDHIIVKNHEARLDSPVSDESLAYLKELSVRIDLEKAILAHSLPFEQELGICCMIRPMGNFELKAFFTLFPEKILIRGHSHSPELIYKDNTEFVVKSLSADQKIDLKDSVPCIITCGALTEGCCLTFHTKDNHVTIYSFS